jgi:SulP family sulfate permease
VRFFDGSRLSEEWFGNLRGDVVAGVVVALALIPEAIAFSIIAGVDPKVGLYASFSIAVITAIAGGRPGMISAATAATAVLMVTLVRDHGLQYLLAATVLAGRDPDRPARSGSAFVMRFVSRSVMTGFVNALAILIFMAQMPELIDVPADLCWSRRARDHLPASAATKAIPSPLVVTIIVLTGAALCVRLGSAHRRRHGRAARHAAGVPDPRHPADAGDAADHPALFGAVAVVGLLESADDRRTSSTT